MCVYVLSLCIGMPKYKKRSYAEVVEGPMRRSRKYVGVNVGQTCAESSPSCASASFKGGLKPLFVLVFHRTSMRLPICPKS